MTTPALVDPTDPDLTPPFPVTVSVCQPMVVASLRAATAPAADLYALLVEVRNDVASGRKPWSERKRRKVQQKTLALLQEIGDAVSDLPD